MILPYEKMREHKVSSSSLIELEDMATNRIDELKVQLCQHFNELICRIALCLMNFKVRKSTGFTKRTGDNRS
jgi:hypothetical protein